jgi:hypothetical protein
LSSASVISGEAGERALLTLWPNNVPSSGKTRAYQGAESWYRDRVYFPTEFQASRNTDWNWLYELHNYPDGSADANLALSVVMDTSDLPGSQGGTTNGERLSTRILGGGSPTNPIDPYKSSNVLSNPDAKAHWFVGPAIQRGHWYDLVWHVKWDWRSPANGGAGLAEYWIDGAKIGSYSGPTLFYYSSQSGPGQAYLQSGYYRPNDTTAGYSQPTAKVYHGATMIGPTAASIGTNLP